MINIDMIESFKISTVNLDSFYFFTTANNKGYHKFQTRTF